MKKIAVSIAQQAGGFLLRHFQRDSSLLLKRATAKELTTKYDKQSDSFIVKELTKHFPKHSIIAEESGFHKRKNDFKSDQRKDKKSQEHYLWIVDPLDGSTNFARGFPFFAVSIALQKDDELVLGIIYAPALDELYVAEKGKGAFLNGKRIHVSAISRLSQSYLVSCEGGEKTNKRISKINARLHPLVKDLRKLGSAALEGASVACSRTEAYFATKMNAWDVAGAVVLVREAGGKVTDFRGNHWIPRKGDIIFSNRKIHDKILKKVC